jgi:hypothetical protein
MSRKPLRGDRCRCSGCGEYFTTTSTFDRHRKGPYTDRTCLSVDALFALGWKTNKYGFWMRPGKPRVAGAYDYEGGVRA